MTTQRDVLRRVEDLYEQGQYVKAFEAGKALGPVKAWPGTEGRILGGRLAQNLGAPRLGRALFRLAWRADPKCPKACYYYGNAAIARFGPLPAWKFLKGVGGLPEASPAVRANWFGLHAEVLAALRDFERAEHWLARAERLAPQEPYFWVQRSQVLEHEDRLDEALQSARQAMELQPWFRPGVQILASLLCQLNRDDEALQILAEASARMESGMILWQLAALEVEMRRFADACDVFARMEHYLPLLEDALAKQLAAMHADAAYQNGDFAKAARFAPLAKHPYFDNMAERLSGTLPEGRRRILPVDFVRQHHQTCAPATLAALCRYWCKPADQQEIAEEICYGGTSSLRERAWVEEHGFVACEFCVTEQSALALIDRDIPFALETQGTDWGHLQAVVGYDTRMGTFLVRDPSNRMRGECLIQGLLDAHRFCGPRGMAIIPREQAELLAGIELPGRALFDLSYRLRCALEAHDRDEAQQRLNEMRALEPNHWLTIDARARLAHYDSDLANLLHCLESLLRKFPDTGRFLLSKLNCLRDLARRDDRLALLKEICNGPASEAIFWQRYAEELIDDARQHGTAAYWLRRAIRARPQDGTNYRLLADTLWTRRLRKEALELYRLAACLEETNEECAKAYFAASRHLHETESALGFLRDRFQRFGSQSSRPAHTLCWAYDQLDRAGEAFGVLDEAIRLRPADGDLRLESADLRASYGHYEEAREHLSQAKGSTHHIAWLQSSAHLARCQGDTRAAVRCWREIVEADPLLRHGHEMLACLLADTEGHPAAVGHLRDVARRFPRNFTLRTLLIEWLRNDDPAEWEAAVREILEIHPVNPWARRELAFALNAQNKFEEAKAEAEVAWQLDPASPAVHVVLGNALCGTGNVALARDAYRTAIRLSVDHDPAIAALLGVSNTKDERRDALVFVYEELVRQVIFGDGLLTFRQYAADTLEPLPLLGILHEALEARPDLWHAWSALVRQLTEMERHEEALRWAEKAVDRFPLTPRLWLDLAMACRARDDRQGEVRAIEKALEINPSWAEAARTLADAHQRAGECDKARAILERALNREPAGAANHGYLADLLWRLDEQDAALKHIQQAARLDPGYRWAWDTLRDWSRQLERPQLAVDLAREITQTRPYEARSWLILADVLEDRRDRTECFAALDRALALSPRSDWAYHMRAYYLAEDGRYAEALAACRPAVFGEDLPWTLCAQAAEIEAQRGNRDDAIAQMRKIAADNPDSARVWLRLAEWYDESNQDDKYLDAAQRLSRLAPRNPASWNHLGDARRRTQDRTGAIQAFQQALDVDPSHPHAIASLFDLQLEADDLASAQQTLSQAEEHMPEETVLEYRVRLAVALDDRDAAVGHLRSLCLSEGDIVLSLDSAVTSMVRHDWYDLADRVLTEQMESADVNSGVGPVWIEMSSQKKRWRKCARRLKALRDRGDLWCRAGEHYMYRLGNAGEKKIFLRYLRRNRARLRRDVRTWRSAGRELTRLGLYQEAASWMSDWETRDPLEPRVLLCLAVSLWELRREAEAVRVSRRTLELPPDDATSYHRVWLAVHDVLCGDPAAAADELRGIAPASLPDYYRVLYTLANAMVEIGQWPTESRQQLTYSAARRFLRRSVTPHWPMLVGDESLRRIFRRCLWRLAKDQRRFLLAAWHRLREILGYSLRIR